MGAKSSAERARADGGGPEAPGNSFNLCLLFVAFQAFVCLGENVPWNTPVLNMGGAEQWQHGIDFVNSKQRQFHVWAVVFVNVGIETTYEEQHLTPD